jgi:hypothetical protein
VVDRERWRSPIRRGISRTRDRPAGGDLRRLECDYCRIERSDLPRRAARLQSVSLAYDDILCACCKALEIPWSGHPPLAGVDRLEMEASLAQRGVTW